MIIRADDLAQTNQTEWDASWRIAILRDSEYQRVCGKGERGAYTILYSRQFPSWKIQMGDFIDYSEKQNQNALVILSEKELAEVKQSYQGHACNERFLRPDEPAVLVHSTTLECWESIQRDGCLKSWNRARMESGLKEEKPIGHLLGDPEEFRDFIMFGAGVRCEIVVASKQAGHLVYDGNAEYQSGARLYLDAGKMASDGLLLRDGNHLKVKDQLPLNSYLLWAATWKEMGLPDRITTPSVFASIADKTFEKRQTSV